MDTIFRSNSEGRGSAPRPQLIHDRLGFITPEGQSGNHGFRAVITTTHISFYSASVVDGMSIDSPLKLSARIKSIVLAEEMDFVAMIWILWPWSAGAFFRVDEDQAFSIASYLLGALCILIFQLQRHIKFPARGQ